MTDNEIKFNSQPAQTRYYLVWTHGVYLHTEWEQVLNGKLRADIYAYLDMFIAVVNLVKPNGQVEYVNIAAMAWKNMDPFVKSVELNDLIDG